jgi:uncharacterized membrane protein
MPADERDRTAILAHYYRAMVGRADIWRTRMDATSNWAIGATAAMISFTMSTAATPHYVVFISSILTASFLLLEARRLTFYHMWQQRVLLLERAFIRPAMTSEHAPMEAEGDLARSLAPQLGRTVPEMSLRKATARRLRRIYLYLFAVQLFAWGLKLSSHPTPVASLPELLERAAIGPVSGRVSIGATVLLFVVVVAYAFREGGVERKPASGTS